MSSLFILCHIKKSYTSFHGIKYNIINTPLIWFTIPKKNTLKYHLTNSLNFNDMSFFFHTLKALEIYCQTMSAEKTKVQIIENGDSTEENLYPQLDAIIDNLKNEPGALIPVLQATQNLFGYLPEKALKVISRKLGKPYSEVAGVVGFYSYFSTNPKGKHTVRVCMGTACYVRGGQEVLKAFIHELKVKVSETTPDRMFTLDVGRCFGACGLAPVVMIDDVTFQSVKPSKTAEIIKKYE